MKAQNQSLSQKVLDMRNQGLSDNQIMQSLQQDGHNSREVLDAFEIADQSVASTQMPQPMQGVANPIQNQPVSMAPPSMPRSPMSPPNMGAIPPQQNAPKDDDIEELIEAIVDEKWEEIEKNIQKVLEWRETVEQRLKGMEVQIDTMGKSFDDLHKALLGKVGEYDKNILNVGTQLKAMEQVFSKVLPTFTDNVNELSRITDKIRK